MPDFDAPDELPIPFGIYGDTGLPFKGLDEASLIDFKNNDQTDDDLQKYLELKKEDQGPHRGVVGNIRDPNNLDETGWCVIFGPSVDDKIRAALEPLLKHRGVGIPDRDPILFTVFDQDAAPQPGETAEHWLERPKGSGSKNRVRMDAVRPSAGVPYYVMIVAPPDEISFEFQYALDIYWAVGRLWFPSPVEFQRYAESLVRYETMPAAEVPTSKQIALFAPSIPYDDATQAFSHGVAEPLGNGYGSVPRAGLLQKFGVQPFIGASATKENLGRIFAGAIDNGPPALLFSGGHGAWFEGKSPPDDSNQSWELQGALVCQDRQSGGPLKEEYYFAGSHLPAEGSGKMLGMIHFMFACYGGGWPEVDTYSRYAQDKRQDTILAPRPMLARLPQKLLSHPDGGALAVLAHVDRAWSYSFRTRNNPQIQGFDDVLARIMWGDRLGQATDQFSLRWSYLSVGLADILEKARNGINPDLAVLGNQWIARNDARNYIIIGDPAVRLRVDDMPILK